MRAPGRALGGAAAMLAALAVAASAPAGAEATPDPPPVPDAQPALDALEELLESFGPGAGLGADVEALRALAALGDGRPVEAREIAEVRLAADPGDYAAHCVLAAILGAVEGNLARSLHHFERCRALFEARHGSPDESEPWIWHQMALEGLVQVATDMRRYDEALEHIEAWDREYGGERRYPRGWVLANMGRLAEARALAETVLASVDDPQQHATAWQILCVTAAEVRNSEASYAACKRAAELVDADGDAVHLTNAAEAAEGILRMDEAERWLVQATGRELRGSLAAPWAELAHLYLYEGRLAEAVSAAREARAASRRRRAYENAQNRAWHDLVTASVLLVAGHADEAARLTARAESQPDRLGRVSSDSREVGAAVALLDRVASRTAAAERLECASWSEWPASLSAFGEALLLRVRAWLSGRRAVAFYADTELLSGRLQPHAPGFVELAEWVELDLASVVGPGVLAAALAEARARGLVDDQHGYGEAYEAEIARLRGRDAQAIAAADAALARLPAWEALLRARVAAAGAAAALASGDEARALAFFDVVFQLDPGAVRRMELALPARIEASPGDVAAATARWLRRSPRLRESPRGFRVEIAERDGGARACLAGMAGVVLACAEVERERGEAPDAAARRLAAAFHRRAFAPRIDLSQADLRALDGSTTVAAEHSRERLGIVLRDVLAE